MLPQTMPEGMKLQPDVRLPPPPLQQQKMRQQQPESPPPLKN
jgi:hypothetical protein